MKLYLMLRICPRYHYTLQPVQSSHIDTQQNDPEGETSQIVQQNPPIPKPPLQYWWSMLNNRTLFCAPSDHIERGNKMVQIEPTRPGLHARCPLRDASYNNVEVCLLSTYRNPFHAPTE